MSITSQIIGIGHHVPEHVVTNDDLSKLMDTSDEWITERTGIKERRFVERNKQSTSDLALEAAKKAIAAANLEAKDIDLIVAATLSPDFYFPGIAPLIQTRLGCTPIPALDIRVQCSGFVYGLATADAYLRAGIATRALVVCAEVQSQVLEMSNHGRDVAVLFGDGAGACLLEAKNLPGDSRPSTKNTERGVIDSMLSADGSGAEALCVRSPGTATPDFLRHSDIDEGAFRPKMDGRLVFKNAVSRMAEICGRMMQKHGITKDDINLLIPHQANLRINEMLREHVGLKPEQVFNNIQKYGNTTAATIPICLSEAVAESKLMPGDLVMTVAFGAGFTWGCNLMRW